MVSLQFASTRTLPIGPASKFEKAVSRAVKLVIIRL